MSTMAYFCDEDVPAQLMACLAGLEPALLVEGVGLPGHPPKGTVDPQLLLYAEAMHYSFVTRDKSTMITHLIDHANAGHHTWGVFVLKEGHAVSSYANDLLLIWSATEAEEWVDRVEYLPWG